VLNNLNKNLEDLLSWIDKNGYEGWDPYDVQGSEFYTKYLMNKNIFAKITRRLFDKFSFYFPLMTRRVLNLKPRKNAKAMALLCLSFIKFYNMTGDEKYYDKYKEVLIWLLKNNHSNTENTLGWGYPFDWHSLIFIPKETPLCVPTVLVGHAMLDELEHTSNQVNIESLHKIKNFLTKSLNITNINEKEICFSYSPIDDYMVINANLYTASFLTRYAVMFRNKDVLELARKSRRFAMSQQESDGSWPYWSYLYKVKMPKFVDNYHTGIKLQWLKMCNIIDPIDGEKEVIDMGLKYFYENLFSEDGLPKFSDELTYPVDIHGPAQAFVTFNFLDKHTELSFANRVYEFVTNKMMDKKGYFYYRIDKYGHTSKIPYFRWSQAWMLYGLVNLKEYKDKK